MPAFSVITKGIHL